jgi:hypothetical protein
LRYPDCVKRAQRTEPARANQKDQEDNMKRAGTLLATIIAFALVAGTASAQNQDGGMTLRCSTSDGLLLIRPHGIALRDLRFTFESMEAAGVMHLRDRRSGATAVLDTRSDEGIYLTVTEGSSTMQVVAARKDIRTGFSDAAEISDIVFEMPRGDVDFVELIRGSSIAQSGGR